ncbi:hypothetical protein ACFWIQ_23325 [Kitasatospora sp. NPDC127059]|uniref:hypothetical protein n=1 Tax=unclassified Kitasatospora TaxID=2633591 RepID=UPI0036488EE3
MDRRDSPIETQFAQGHRLGDFRYAWDHDPGVDGEHTRLWVATADGGSWAAVDGDGGDRTEQYTVWQHGPRRLRDEVEAAHRWWLDNGLPGPDRLGLTVAPEGQWAWLDHPADASPLG